MSEEEKLEIALEGLKRISAAACQGEDVQECTSPYLCNVCIARDTMEKIK